MIAARLLGPPLISVDGAPAPAELLWRKHLAVCVVLWSSPEQRCSRDRLRRYFWADKDEAAARHSLNEALRLIRKSAGADALETEGDQIRWVGPVDLDTAHFAQLESASPEAAGNLVAGTFCAGFASADEPEFDQWLDAQRRGWTARCVAVLVRAATAAENQGKSADALAYAIKANELDLWSDTAVRALMRARWITGNHAGALADGRAFAARLTEDLDTQPDAQTKALIARVAAGRTPRIHVESVTAARRPPFFGRYQILSRTLSITRSVIAEKKPALIVLTGESGSGRSRLLEEIVLRATLEGEVVATMRAVDGDLDNPHSLWLGLASGGLMDAPGVLGVPTAILAGVAASSSEWATRFPMTRGATGLPLPDAVTGIVRAVADENPLLLAIDDAHRLGERGLLRIPKLLRGLVGMPVTVLVTLDLGVPSAAADELRRMAERDTPGAAMRIDKWDTGDIDQLVSWGLPHWEEADQHRLARRLKMESDGRPALAVELLAAVAQGLSLETLPSAAGPVDRTHDATLSALPPASLVAAVRMAFNRLPESAQALLTIASILPEPFSATHLGRLADISDIGEVETLLDRLEWERWLVADGRGYSFPVRSIRRLIETEMLTLEQRHRLEERMGGVTAMNAGG